MAARPSDAQPSDVRPSDLFGSFSRSSFSRLRWVLQSFVRSRASVLSPMFTFRPKTCINLPPGAAVSSREASSVSCAAVRTADQLRMPHEAHTAQTLTTQTTPAHTFAGGGLRLDQCCHRCGEPIRPVHPVSFPWARGAADLEVVGFLAAEVLVVLELGLPVLHLIEALQVVPAHRNRTVHQPRDRALPAT